MHLFFIKLRTFHQKKNSTQSTNSISPKNSNLFSLSSNHTPPSILYLQVQTPTKKGRSLPTEIPTTIGGEPFHYIKPLSPLTIVRGINFVFSHIRGFVNHPGVGGVTRRGRFFIASKNSGIGSFVIDLHGNEGHVIQMRVPVQ